MSRKDAAVIALRIAGIFAWIKAIQGLPTLAMLIFPPGGVDLESVLGSVPMIAAALVPILLAAAGWLLVTRAPSLARRVVGSAGETDDEPLSGSLVEPALAVIGVVVLVLAIPRTGDLVTSLATILGAWPEWRTPQLERRAYELLIQWLLQMSIGFWLIVRNRDLGRLLARVAHRGPDAD